MRELHCNFLIPNKNEVIVIMKLLSILISRKRFCYYTMAQLLPRVVAFFIALLNAHNIYAEIFALFVFFFVALHLVDK